MPGAVLLELVELVLGLVEAVVLELVCSVDGNVLEVWLWLLAELVFVFCEFAPNVEVLP